MYHFESNVDDANYRPNIYLGKGNEVDITSAKKSILRLVDLQMHAGFISGFFSIHLIDCTVIEISKKIFIVFDVSATTHLC